MRNFIQEGSTLSVLAPNDTDHDGGLAGDGVMVGSIFGVAANDFVAGGAVEVMVEGVFDLAKATGETWAVGNPIYWDDANLRTTTTAGSNTLIGVATEAALLNAATGAVRLNGSFS
jgi:predicted RecA/RadA family phage recombinase